MVAMQLPAFLLLARHIKTSVITLWNVPCCVSILRSQINMATKVTPNNVVLEVFQHTAVKPLLVEGWKRSYDPKNDFVSA